MIKNSINKHKALFVAYFIFTLIGLLCNICYSIMVFLEKFILLPEIIFGFIFSGGYFGIISYSFINYYQYFKKNNKWFTLKSGLIVGFIIFSFFAFYCNIIYVLIPISVGVPIQFEMILANIILGTYFGISSTILVKLGRNFKPKKYRPGRYRILPFKGNLLIFVFVFLFFVFCLNLIFIIFFHGIQINYVIGLIVAGLIVGIFTLFMIFIDPDDDWDIFFFCFD